MRIVVQDCLPEGYEEVDESHDTVSKVVEIFDEMADYHQHQDGSPYISYTSYYLKPESHKNAASIIYEMVGWSFDHPSSLRPYILRECCVILPEPECDFFDYGISDIELKIYEDILPDEVREFVCGKLDYSDDDDINILGFFQEDQAVPKPPRIEDVPTPWLREYLQKRFDEMEQS